VKKSRTAHEIERKAWRTVRRVLNKRYRGLKRKMWGII
jgi:hypothetical protein